MVAVYKPGSLSSPETQPAGNLTLDFPASVRNKRCLSHPACGVLFWQPELGGGKGGRRGGPGT